MISSNAAMALSIARGLIKLAGRMDRLLAERQGVTSDLILTMPPLTGGPSGVEMVNELKDYFEKTKDDLPDPMANVRHDIQEELDRPVPDPAKITKWYTLIFPEKALFPVFDPDSEYIKNLKAQFPQLNLTDKDILCAAFYVGPGKDQREVGYTWRMALLITDVLAEFGADTTALFTRDDRLRSVIQSVLVRFSKPDFESYHTWSPFVRDALSATLNGVLDARRAYQGDDPWFNALLNALAGAREKVEDGDNYVLGLIKGKGYNSLIGECLTTAADNLDRPHAGDFEKIIGEVLREAAPLARKSHSFGAFFQDHWTDLAHAGLASLEKHGPTLLKGTSPLLRDGLLAIVKELSQETDVKLLGGDVLSAMTEAILGAFSAHPDLLVQNTGAEWLRELIRSIVKTVSDQGVRASLSKEGLEALIRDGVGAMAENPELIVQKQGLFQALIGAILTAVKGVESLDAESIATAATAASLEVLGQDPFLLNTRYPGLVADCAQRLAMLVASKKINRIQAADIVAVAAEAVTLNPLLFAGAYEKLVGEVIELVVEAAHRHGEKLITGAALVEVIREVLGALASHGLPLLDTGSLGSFQKILSEVVTAGITRTVEQLGKKLNLSSLPVVLAGLISALARGDITAVDSSDPHFIAIFDSLAGLAKA